MYMLPNLTHVIYHSIKTSYDHIYTVYPMVGSMIFDHLFFGDYVG